LLWLIFKLSILLLRKIRVMDSPTKEGGKVKAEKEQERGMEARFD
jgi:hypothetical protein